MIRARRRSIYCSPAEWAEITERARSAGMKNSPCLSALRIHTLGVDCVRELAGQSILHIVCVCINRIGTELLLRDCLRARTPFVIACALAEDEEERPDTLLALTEEEQRTLYDRVAFLDRCARAMYERLPGSDLSMFEVLAFLERAASLRRKPPE